MEGFGIFEETSVEECRRETGRMPVDTKWVDVNKGSEAEPVVRSRLVARDFKPKGEKERGDLFAAMPPLEAKKMLFSIAASHPRVLRGGKWMRPKLMFIDVKKAHLNGVVKDEERAYVSMPGDPPGRCRRLRKWLYGMRPAANAWEEDFSGKLAGMGLKAGKSSSVVFCDVEREVRCVVHGDDFTLLAYEDDLERLRVAMSEAYLMTVRGVLGPDPKDQKEITILNRKLVWSEGGLTYEADANHARKILEDMGLHASSNGLDKPCIKETAQDIEQDDVELDPQEMTSFRSIAARANYLAQDRPDLQFATKEICRRMAKPTRGCWTAMKRLARYLVQYPRLVFTFADLGYIPDSIQVYSDSDWAGCIQTRSGAWGNGRETLELDADDEGSFVGRSGVGGFRQSGFRGHRGPVLGCGFGVACACRRVRRLLRGHWHVEQNRCRESTAPRCEGLVGAGASPSEADLPAQNSRGSQSRRPRHEASVRRGDDGQAEEHRCRNYTEKNEVE